MAINLGSLLTGATKSVGAYDQNREAAQHQAEQDTLSRALLMRQISQQDEQAKLAAALNAAKVRNLDALAGTKGQRIVQSEDGSFYVVNPAQSTATAVHEAPGATPATAAPAVLPQPEAPSEINLDEPQTPQERGVPAAPPPQKTADLGKVLQGKKPVTPYAQIRDEKIQRRIDQIRATNPRISLEDANKQARAEAGLQPQAPPTPQFSTVKIGGEGGQPDQVLPFDARTGKAGTPIGQAPTTAQNSAQRAVTQKVGTNAMRVGIPKMEAYEEKLRNGTASISGLNQFLGTAGASFTRDDATSRLIQTTALTVLNHTNPDLARYIRQGLEFAEAESQINQRPSDFRTKLSAFLSLAAAGATPEMIDDIQLRRRSIFEPLDKEYPQEKAPGAQPVAPQAGGAAPAPVAKKTITRAQYDGLIKLGRTPEEIQAHYTVQP